MDQYLQALDIHLSVAILRVSKGLDYSQLLGEEVPVSIFEIPKTLQSNDSSADLKVGHTTIHGSCDSLSRNVSQGMGQLISEDCFSPLNNFTVYIKNYIGLIQFIGYVKRLFHTFSIFTHCTGIENCDTICLLNEESMPIAQWTLPRF